MDEDFSPFCFFNPKAYLENEYRFLWNFQMAHFKVPHIFPSNKLFIGGGGGAVMFQSSMQ